MPVKKEIAMTTLAELREMARVKPFPPFSMVLNTGRVFHIAYADNIGIGPTAKVRFVVAEGETYHLVDTDQVVSITLRDPDDYEDD